MSFEAAFTQICHLVDTFHANEHRYLSSEYQEAEVRKDFIDKFWIALGWDVNHDHQTNPYEQEVKVERSIQAGPAQRRADYGFYLAPDFRTPKFYVEAKKPHGEIATPDSYFQTIRYGWNSDHPVAVLTDFEQFHILDSRHEPRIEGVLQKALKRYHYTEYSDREKFAEVYWFFSREALATGSFDRRVAELPRPKGGAVARRLFPGAWRTVDDRFLEDLDAFRITLARTFKANNPAFDGETLTELAQRTLDRLVFLRFLEDRGIEPGRIVDRFGDSGPAWQDFIAASRRMDSVYNGIVFKSHPILDAPEFQVDDSDFSRICERLAALNTPYEFNHIPIHILGSIYERFLGKVIVATEKRVRVEEKPEVRRAGGVYYTPEYIVRYIVEKTVGAAIAGKTPTQIAQMRFADIACGSGSFLLGMYEYLLEYHGLYYNANPSKAKRADCIQREGKLYLSLAKKREILLANIFGVDIDPQAVEVAQLSLYLRLLKDETPETAHQLRLAFAHDAQMKRLLPDLTSNIVCGNSLIGTDLFTRTVLLDEEEERKANPMSFSDRFPAVMRGGGFDVIVGNPPYDVLEKDRMASSWPHHVLADYVRVNEEYQAALGGKLNLFRFFVVRSLSLLKANGRVGMIVPLALLADISCSRTRRHLMLSAANLEADCFPQKDNPNRRVFKDAKLSTVVYAGRRATVAARDAEITIRVYRSNTFEDLWKEAAIRLEETKLLDPVNTPIPLVDTTSWEVCKRLHRRRGVRRLGDVSDISITRGEINQTIYRKYITGDSGMARLVKGVEIGQFHVRERLSQGEHEWLNERAYVRNHGSRDVAGRRRIATQRITGVDERLRLVATIIEPPAYFADSTNSITVRDGSRYRLEYLLGLLNSSLFQWRFKLTSTNNNVGTNELDALPFRTIDFENLDERTRHDEIVWLVEQITETIRHLGPTTSNRTQAYYASKRDSLRGEIDNKVFALFGLSDSDIELVAASERKPGHGTTGGPALPADPDGNETQQSGTRGS